MLMQPFLGYADFECILTPVNDVEDVTTGIVPPSEKDKETSERTEEEYQTHVPASYFTKFVSIDPEFCLPEQENFPQKETYVGEDAAEHFLDYVQLMVFTKNTLKK